MINHALIVHLAVEAARDHEDGYYGEYNHREARESLQAVDPEFDWEPLLKEHEPKAYEPSGPPSEMAKALMAIYLPVLKEQFEDSPLLTKLAKR